MANSTEFVEFSPPSIIIIRELQDHAERLSSLLRTWPPIQLKLDGQFVLGRIEEYDTWEVRWPATSNDTAFAVSHIALIRHGHTKTATMDRLMSCREVRPDVILAAIRYCRQLIEKAEEKRAETSQELGELKAELDYLLLAGLVPAGPDENELLYPVAHALLTARDGKYSSQSVKKIVADVIDGCGGAITSVTVSRSNSRRFLHVVVPAGKVSIHITVNELYLPGEAYGYIVLPDESLSSDIDEYNIRSLAGALARVIFTPGEALLTKRVAAALVTYQEGQHETP
jgi:hypothetical protein